MKISAQWIRDFLPAGIDTNADPANNRSAEALTLAGLPCENIEKIVDADHGVDVLLDVEVTSNRADCLCHLGVARELSALQNLELKTQAIESIPSTGTPATTIDNQRPDACFIFTARIIRGVKVGPSPAWLVRRLESVGLRSINNVVDATNYVLMEIGQPSHVFDFNKLDGGRIVIRSAHAGEKLMALDGKERTLDESMLVIADASKAQSIAGIMGGSQSGVTESTVDILLEVARFDPMTIRKTARKLALSSDSCYRFERGIDPDLQLRASDRLTGLILQLAGGRVDGPLVVAGAVDSTRHEVSLRVEKLKKLLGIEADAGGIASVLGRLGFEVTFEGEVVKAIVPTHRRDVRIEEDLIEEYARVIGYDAIPTRDAVSIRLTSPDVVRERTDVIRQHLVSSGCFESLTFSFVSDVLAPFFTPVECGLLRVEHGVRKADGQLRPSILPNLLESVKRNQDAGTSGARLFEVASVFWLDGQTPVEKRAVGIVMEDSFSAVRGVVESLLTKLDQRRKVKVVPSSEKGFAPEFALGFALGASGRVMWGGEVVGDNGAGDDKWVDVGVIGVASRAVAQAAGLRVSQGGQQAGLPVMAQLWLEPLLEGVVEVPTLVPLSKFPGVARDLSLVLAESVAFADVEALVRKLTLENLESVSHITTYRGKPLEKGTKSLSIQLTFRSDQGTLTSESVDGSVNNVIAKAQSELAAVLRV